MKIATVTWPTVVSVNTSEFLYSWQDRLGGLSVSYYHSETSRAALANTSCFNIKRGGWWACWQYGHLGFISQQRRSHCSPNQLGFGAEPCASNEYLHNVKVILGLFWRGGCATKEAGHLNLSERANTRYPYGSICTGTIWARWDSGTTWDYLK